MIKEYKLHYILTQSLSGPNPDMNFFLDLKNNFSFKSILEMIFLIFVLFLSFIIVSTANTVIMCVYFLPKGCNKLAILKNKDLIALIYLTWFPSTVMMMFLQEQLKTLH